MRKQTFTTKPNNKISTLFVITVGKSIRLHWAFLTIFFIWQAIWRYVIKFNKNGKKSL